ncbi:MAG: hypothetical protein IT303_10565 [Dehalococcoidia bacterium]|nr:hypothetical protein [Dehalococcoidia bacterium]
MHAWRGWHWWPDADPFEVIVGSILVQNTAWTNVERALERLRAAEALTPAAMASLSDDQLEDLVRPSGQYRQKARKLRAFLALCDRHGGLDALLALPPDTLRAELLATWGIGPETADCIVCYAACAPVFVVDAYTDRIFTRLGFEPADGRTYAGWQQLFAANLPTDRDLWARYHALVVLHAKHTCRKLRPACDTCTLAARCPTRRSSGRAP